MIDLRTLILAMALATTAAGAEEDFKFPPEVTPALRAACEADVRRLCVSAESTARSVRRCVLLRYRQFGEGCRREIAAAGLTP